MNNTKTDYRTGGQKVFLIYLEKYLYKLIGRTLSSDKY